MRSCSLAGRKLQWSTAFFTWRHHKSCFHSSHSNFPLKWWSSFHYVLASFAKSLNLLLGCCYQKLKTPSLIIWISQTTNMSAVACRPIYRAFVAKGREHMWLWIGSEWSVREVGWWFEADARWVMGQSEDPSVVLYVRGLTRWAACRAREGGSERRVARDKAICHLTDSQLWTSHIRKTVNQWAGRTNDGLKRYNNI